MNTRLLPADPENIALAAQLIRQGKLVGFPTETVYGLGADALNAQAVLDIFAAKGRPADNPLIVHIARFEEMAPLCHINAMAKKLADAFWPGPLTMILPKKETVPAAVTAGLLSVAIRMPEHPVARALIAESGCPIAAPSGNRSGRPSPTLATHMLEDMDRRIPLILDGGPCRVGVESTVVSLTDDTAVVLRPGGITPEMIAAVLGECRVADSVMRPLKEGEAAPSPGMKHKHYAPKAHMTLYEGGAEAVSSRIKAEYDALLPGEKGLILAVSSHLPLYGSRSAADLGADEWAAAHNIFATLRQADADGVTRVFSESFPETGVGLAVMNRMARAAGFDIVKL
ncbi:MAG: threonylcarbamoyl-AMP synthase [Clostridia bacterium]|nr:threonylcarbamoyl-AMP synthase [Clostridia bacterium]